MNDNINPGNKIESLKSVIIGGTFNEFHYGHQEYIKLAFEYGDIIHIFLSSDDYARICKSCDITPYELRKQKLEDFIPKLNKKKQYKIYELDSERTLIHFCLNNDITMAIVSPEYYSLFQKISRIREDENKPDLLILIKPRAKTKEGLNINSTLINNLKSSYAMAPVSYSEDLAAHLSIP